MAARAGVRAPPRALPFTLALCLAEILGMAGTMAFPALLPVFSSQWALSATQAGWLNGIFQAGYVAAVPVLVTLTDRVDPRRVYLASTALAAVSLAGFALLADGFWTALAFRLAGGVALAGTYMPGLRILGDHVGGPRQSRYLSFYTASFALGSAGSVLLAGLAGEAWGWRTAFAASALATLAALAIVMRTVPAAPPGPRGPQGALLDFRPVLRNRPAMGYILAYAAHCWELFGFRAWIVAFLAFAAALEAGTGEAASVPPLVTALATGVLLLGMPASVLGNEAAMRWGRHRVLCTVMLLSAALACVVGFTAGLPLWAVAAVAALYGVTVNLDSASLTVGVVGAAGDARRGATMAVHSLLGFGAAFLGSVAFGAVLDAAGGGTSQAAWGLAFAAQGAVVALGPLALVWSARR